MVAKSPLFSWDPTCVGASTMTPAQDPKQRTNKISMKETNMKAIKKYYFYTKLQQCQKVNEEYKKN